MLTSLTTKQRVLKSDMKIICRTRYARRRSGIWMELLRDWEDGRQAFTMAGLDVVRSCFDDRTLEIGRGYERYATTSESTMPYATAPRRSPNSQSLRLTPGYAI